MAFIRKRVYGGALHSLLVVLLLLSLSVAAGAASPSAPLTMTELKNATYTGIDTTPITLVDGRYEGAPYVPGGNSRQRLELLDSQPAAGDLNADGTDETVVFLTENNGGTDSCLYMAVMGREKGTIVTLGAVRLGERLSVRAVSVEKRQITLELLQYGAKDAACCPSELATRSWSMEGVNLVELVTRKRPGTLSLATLSGGDWLFRGFDPLHPAQVASGATLLFQKEQISGASGCNRYIGSAAATKVPGTVTLKAIKVTNTDCGTKVMSDEQRYLDALRRVSRFGYFVGDLLLSWQKEDGSLGTMRFSPRKNP